MEEKIKTLIKQAIVAKLQKQAFIGSLVGRAAQAATSYGMKKGLSQGAASLATRTLGGAGAGALAGGAYGGLTGEGVLSGAAKGAAIGGVAGAGYHGARRLGSYGSKGNVLTGARIPLKPQNVSSVPMGPARPNITANLAGGTAVSGPAKFNETGKVVGIHKGV